MEFLGPLRALGTPTSIAITGTLFFAAFLFYRWLLPKPIPGIPYDASATKSIFGDIPNMLKHLEKSKEVTNWMKDFNTRHDSPIVQIFLSMFQKPVVMIDDYRESQDILLRRTKEFDKPDFISDIFYGINPDFHTVQATNDTFRSSRKLLQDLMTPTFLNGVAAPYLHASFVDLMTLWSEKSRLSEGRPFSVKTDIYETALDAIWAAFFGDDGSGTVTRSQIEHLRSLKNVPIPSSKEEAVEFKHVEGPPAFEAILRLTDSIEHCSKSPFPRLAGVALRYFPSMRRHAKAKDQAIVEQISKAEARINQEKGNSNKVTNALDLMLRREKQIAQKQGRAPNYYSKAIKAELFGLLIAGHDTTSTTLLWSLKFLAAHPSIQTKLRSALHTGFPLAKFESRVPNAHEIASTQIHYLDACIEEFLRVGQTAPMASRTTTQDVKVLGHVVPKGTMVFMIGGGAGILDPVRPIPDSLRSQQYLNASGGKTRDWSASSVSEFEPERWLVKDAQTGQDVFDAQAGPHIQFGGGPRGCFGKRLAYLELRLAVVLSVWSWVFDGISEEFGSFEAMEQLTHSPVHCHVKIRPAEVKVASSVGSGMRVVG
ncbi:cytochrome P450 [Setomelanomma holmii]|uniref:Cytochrome P450 n=1 Tax=Setomelanomma holmii TaxID=210430 RepID=A0A9P4LJM5_9PLEO|nr:cytochrome P450 [Setomelanomma holmii]